MRPHVLFLVVDSLRYDIVFGDDAVDTPAIDRLAERGVVFDQCLSQGISTAPSMTAMLTGRYPLDYGGHRFIGSDQPTFAEEFKRRGYTTTGIHSNPHLSRVRNYDKGFDTFNESILPVEPVGPLSYVPHKGILLANKVARVLRRTPYLPADKVNDQLKQAFRDSSDPLFAWAQYMDVHGPYLPGGDVSYRAKFEAERLWQKAAVNSPEAVTDAEHDLLWENYRKETRYVDRKIGELLDFLDGADALEETVVVVVGDHGDEFYEHRQYGHGNLPYEELIHVPMLISLPEELGVEPGRVDEWNRCIDILPTVLDLVSGELSEPMRQRMQGESLCPVIAGKRSPTFDVVVTEKEMLGKDDLRISLRTDEWKYIYDGLEDTEHLYDLNDDPGERDNVVEDNDTVAARFRERLRERTAEIERTSKNITVPDIENRSGVDQRLEALGYVEE